MSVMDWINANKLSLNIDQTKCMKFHTKGRYFSGNVDASISNKIVNRWNWVKFLGVTIDSTFSCLEHVTITITDIKNCTIATIATFKHNFKQNFIE